MIWQNPWAWAGLLLLALPVLIHLLGRRNARILRFPTLRFLHAAPLLSTRRTRLTDLLLLAVRLAILAAAVAALARPLFLTADRERALASVVARAIVVDTSASMSRQAAGGGRAVDAAMQDAARLAAEAGTSVILSTGEPRSALAGAGAWLALQPGRAEVILLSDFQEGTLHHDDIARIPEWAGVRLMQVELPPDTGQPVMVMRQGGADVSVRVASAGDRNEVEWTLAAAQSGADASGLLMLAGGDESARAMHARDAAIAVASVPPLPGTRPLAIVHPGYPGYDDLMRDATPIGVPWMGDVVVRIRGDSMLALAAATADAASIRIDERREVTFNAASGDAPAREGTGTFTALARTREGQSLAFAASAEIEGRNHLVIYSMAEAGSLVSAALMLAALRASSPFPGGAELDPALIPAGVLANWERPSATVRARAGAGASAAEGMSDGRWLWLVVLLLLGAETLIRIRSAPASVREPSGERAAA